MFEKAVDFCLTTIERYDCLENLLASIAKYGYKNTIYVADQNRRIKKSVYKKYPNVVVVDAPYDIGLSAARNMLVRRAKAPLILLLEDDFEFTAKTNIYAMANLINVAPDIGIVGGQVQQLDIPINFEWVPVVKDGTLYHMPDGDNYHKAWHDMTYKYTGAVLNFAIMRRDLLKLYPWDDNLKLREHADFYLQLAKKSPETRIIYTPDVVIKDAKPSRYNDTYKKLKARDEFMVQMMIKNGLKRIYYQNGTVRELVDGQIATYKDKPLSTPTILHEISKTVSW